ncbi:MAG TPA: ParA family protein, partial [Anaeromyxobacter sp.]
MRRIAFINEKGGTCKTTLCVNVAAWLADHGKRVLVADMDTQ